MPLIGEGALLHSSISGWNILGKIIRKEVEFSYNISREDRRNVRLWGQKPLWQLMPICAICHIHLGLKQRIDEVLLARLADSISGRGQKRSCLRVDERHGSRPVPTKWQIFLFTTSIGIQTCTATEREVTGNRAHFPSSRVTLETLSTSLTSLLFAYLPSLWNNKGKGKAIPLQTWTGPEGSRRLRLPDFVTTAHEGGKVVSLTNRPPLSPRKYSWYSFLLEAESTAGPMCSRKDYVNEKCQWHHRESNPWPSSVSVFTYKLNRPSSFQVSRYYLSQWKVTRPSRTTKLIPQHDGILN